MEQFDFTLIDWSRAQFALTALYHWLFVPLTLGITFIIAIMETIYVKTGNVEWKKITKFWMTLFGINFAIGVATGIILEFEFGTNWSNYSWFVGDIFGAPLAIEGIMAFFMESTFIAIMFFGWNKVSKGFHLTATWLTAIGSNLSALWILVANGWMQNPIGMNFNPDTARMEMNNFWEVLFNPNAINKFLHTIYSSYILAAVFVLGISAWYLLKNREAALAKKSILVAAIFGFIFSVLTIGTGDESAREIAKSQPMKFAAMEGLYYGTDHAPLVAAGILKDDPIPENAKKKDFFFEIEIPSALSYMAFLDGDAFVAGIHDLVHGNEEQGIMSYYEKMERGKIARQALTDFKLAKKDNNEAQISKLTAQFEDEDFLNNYFAYFGYSYFDNPHDIIPSVPFSFYSFHIMVVLGGHFLVLFMVVLFFLYKEKLHQMRWLLWLAVWTMPLAYVASESGWIIAEMGRQPWVIQDLMPTTTAVSNIDINSVIITFALFFITFTALLIAEIKIMLKQIHIGPNEGGH
ncbi:cytochrome ubiquinol oxidase subunit I [Lentimicrobium sp. S6]|uniref:cytochrome ubiquinol oxidase subunit I n=1 Tax=Lentimicrobium sp. S6 TaxID=2735872 RepID=UPI001556EADB|nr:cytochrome ubiquinol oxidase subunit I [Lentimicrobium sp. S6]NPD44976.1 cytochrome ubiquinol oxidase subunit I [Lentimicrobium sp. S6]